MDNQTPPQTPPPSTVANSATVPPLTLLPIPLTYSQIIKNKLKAISADVGTAAKDIWNDNKVIFAILIPIIAVIYGRNFLMGLIVKQAKQTITDATKQDATLQTQENAANAQVNTLVQQANDLPAQEKPVDDDWFKNEH